MDKKKIEKVAFAGITFLVLCVCVYFTFFYKQAEQEQTDQVEIDANVTRIEPEFFHTDSGHRYCEVVDCEGYVITSLYDDFSFRQEKTFTKLWIRDRRERNGQDREGNKVVYITDYYEGFIILPEGDINIYEIPPNE